jgi:hypothetical protein
MAKLGKELAKQADKKGICQEWYYQMEDMTDKEELIGLYLKGIDFCLSNEYPSLDYIRKHFVGVMEKHHIYLDNEILAKNPKKLVALGKCKGAIEVSGYETSQLFIKHDSEIVLVVKDNAFVMVDIFDNAKLRVTATDSSKVCVNRYIGAEVFARKYGNAVVKEIEKNKKTY